VDGRGERDVCDIIVSARVRKLAQAAGVKMTMTSLRRGFGCRYAARVPAQVLQRLMRHSNISVTMDYYANVDDAAMEAVLGAKRNNSRNTRPISSTTQVEPECESADARETCDWRPPHFTYSDRASARSSRRPS
jgi:hypothetical protein